MKTRSQILIILLLIIKNFGKETEILQSTEITEEESVTESTVRNIELKPIESAGQETELQQNSEIKAESNIRHIELESIKNVGQETDILNNSVITEESIMGSVTESILRTSELEAIKKLSQETVISKNSEIIEESITESTVRNTELETKTNVFQETGPLQNNESVMGSSIRTTELEGINNVTTENFINTKELESLNDVDVENTTKIMELGISEEVTTETSVQIEEMQENTATNIHILEKKLISEQIVSKTSNEEIQIILKDTTPITFKQDEIKEISLKLNESLSDETSNTTVEGVLSTKPSVSLEDYAVKHMNFILDQLLIETQEFVVKVLQATVNMVFKRDYLKRYAEGLNRILNPENDSDYSDDIIEDSKNMMKDDLYDEILLKLNFLKSKPSKNLQRHLPHDWLIEYRSKRAEMAVWLDKAAEQMHQEFQHYVTEEEDRIKYQYFNEAFDDISRATEIHNKLALLADLVKIVKNKKQITFMDLYMQT